MPFKSKSQERAAFAGYLGPEMKKAAPEWASKTPKKIPEKKKRSSDTGYINNKK